MKKEGQKPGVATNFHRLVEKEEPRCVCVGGGEIKNVKPKL